MFLLKFVYKAFTLLIALVLLVAMAQFCAFVLLADDSKKLHNADLIVLFPGGGNERESITWRLAEQGLAPNLMIVNNTAKHLKTIAAKYQNLEQLNLLEGGNSRSTFEDSYVASEIIQKNGFDSVILVTSSYHMPRALFLLKTHLLCLGMEVGVQYFPVIAEEKNTLPVPLGIYYNEMVKIWGSIVEIAGYHLTGKLMYDSPLFQKLSKTAHRYLMYKS